MNEAIGTRLFIVSLLLAIEESGTNTESLLSKADSVLSTTLSVLFKESVWASAETNKKIKKTKRESRNSYDLMLQKYHALVQ